MPSGTSSGYVRKARKVNPDKQSGDATCCLVDGIFERGGVFPRRNKSNTSYHRLLAARHYSTRTTAVLFWESHNKVEFGFLWRMEYMNPRYYCHVKSHLRYLTQFGPQQRPQQRSRPTSTVVVYPSRRASPFAANLVKHVRELQI